MKARHLIIIMTAALAVFSCSSRRSRSASDVGEANDSIPPLGFWTDSLSLVEGSVKTGETFGGLLTRLGMTPEDGYSLIKCCDSVFDVKKFRAGNKWEAYYDADSTLQYIVYINDKIHSTVFKCKDSLGVWTAEKPTVKALKASDVTINSSLWNDMLAAGASPLLIVKLSDIFAWTVDFFGLQEGDRFRLLYGETLCEDEVISIDTVYYATYNDGAKDLVAIAYDQGNGGNIYWNEKGESLRKAFLKAPLNFSRISSGFTYHRKHPISGKVKPHTAVDYAAPTGTPVMSIGDGTVLSVGWAGGGGNTVKIRHNSVYTTSYMHLSRYAKGLKAGQHVKQGQVIGYVGSTGSSTGPHLDFRVWQNGSPINPLKMESPSEEPILKENMAPLDSVRQVYAAKLEEMLNQPREQ